MQIRVHPTGGLWSAASLFIVDYIRFTGTIPVLRNRAFFNIGCLYISTAFDLFHFDTGCQYRNAA